jgi:glycosyltransferase involved in cell wall biosynthesis
MTGHAVKKLHIVGNTSSSTEAFARRTTEISNFVSGIDRQNTEIARYLSGEKRLTLIKTHPTMREQSTRNRITRHTLPLQDTLKTKNPNDIYRKAGSLDELKSHFEPLISEMAGIVKEADVVLLGGTYFVPWALLQAARMHNKPTVLCYAGILSMEIKHLPEEIQSTLKLMEQDFYDPNIFYIFPSKLTKKTVQAIFDRKIPNNAVIYNGVPAEFLAVKGPSEKAVPIAFVGRNTFVKNPEFLLKLADALRALGSLHRIHMVTKIDPENDLIKELRGLGAIVLEPLDTPKLAEFYRTTSIIVSPSHFETFGNVPLEAVSSGTPALVSPSMGVSEVFAGFGMGEYVTGFDDPYAIAERAERAIKEKETVPEGVREKIRRDLSWPSVISRYLEVCISQVEGTGLGGAGGR